jgi:phospholipase C
LLVITYDEHGGVYDHVPPTQRVANPDGKNWAGANGNPDPAFDFTWLGVRVPAILISPYIQAGSIDHNVYEHSSAIATVRKLFIKNWESSFLTQRDKDAKTFEGNLSLLTARTDTIQFPVQMAAAAAAVAPAQLVLKPLTEHQKSLVMMGSYLEQQLPPERRSKIDPHTIRTEGAAAKYLQQVMSQLQASAPPAPPRRANPPR